MALSPMPGSEHRVVREERVTQTSQQPRAEVGHSVDEEAARKIRQEELDERWRLAGREE